MATKINKLSARQVDSFAPGFYSDGAGLYLRVRHSGSRSWVFRYTRQGKVREIGLGGVHGRSLAGARSLAGDMRKSLANGCDPATLVPERAGVPATTPTFRDCAEALIASKRPGWRNPKHAQQWEHTLRDFVVPHIGDKTPAAVSLADVKAILTPIWTTKTETATRVRQRIEAVLDWAYVHELRSGENPARWRGVLDKVLSPPNKIRTVKHFAAMPYRQIPKLMASLRAKPHSSARCLQFLILTAARSIEARGASWEEFDFEGGVWTIPTDRMKAHRPHRVPLSDAALRVLTYTPRIVGQPLVFSGTRRGRLSDVALTKAVRAFDATATVHGFRSAFREWAAEQTNCPAAVCELALAHVNEDRVEAAYQRSDLFEKRRALMQAWADYVSAVDHIASVHQYA